MAHHKPPERINPYRQFFGVFVPLWLLERREVTMMAKVLYAILCARAGRKGCCWPSQLWIATRLGVTDRQVRNYLRELVELRLVEVEQRGRTRGGVGRSACYWFLKHRWFDTSAKYAWQSISGHNVSPGTRASGQKPPRSKSTRARPVDDPYRGGDSRRGQPREAPAKTARPIARRSKPENLPEPVKAAKTVSDLRGVLAGKFGSSR